MSLGPDDVKNIAHLARLEIEEKNIEGYTDNLSGILNLVEQMNAVDTENVKPMAHPMDVSQRLRADEVLEENQRETFQKIAPKTEDGLYLVPQVIE
ncbi:Aspartyl-tRNA(Asn) amidotransferase subunit C @ Glutamyl-tRNA(Gln) amidotransferase subunit C [hydrothermal vent metagenome]|uniref:Aspartyl-tRNA(Asn) amidotransferase subunit C @ Glutamyl-tRNA(Gln) amidotransferase subunit C n=1 Tax=hydrothermal vent metagenome TaxID=652676 RepID=A0A3B0XW68_9ZZZZ